MKKEQSEQGQLCRGTSEKDNSGKDKSEKGQFGTGTEKLIFSTGLKRTTLNRKTLKKDSSEKLKSERGQFWK